MLPLQSWQAGLLPLLSFKDVFDSIRSPDGPDNCISRLVDERTQLWLLPAPFLLWLHVVVIPQSLKGDLLEATPFPVWMPVSADTQGCHIKCYRIVWQAGYKVWGP